MKRNEPQGLFKIWNTQFGEQSESVESVLKQYWPLK